MESLKKLTLQDLKIGMHVKTEQLSDLYGVWIYIDPTTITNNKDEVDILYFCTSETKDDKMIQKIQDKYGKASTIAIIAPRADRRRRSCAGNRSVSEDTEHRTALSA